MKNHLEKINKKALRVISEYQNIEINGVKVKVPYFTNKVEHIYKDSMRHAGTDKELINRTIEIIKSGKTPIGSCGGKESPKEITASLERLTKHLLESGTDLAIQDPSVTREWMKMFHIGLDCSGFVYNIIVASLSSDHVSQCLNQLAWKDARRIESSRANVSVFNTSKLRTINNMLDLQPFDLFIYKNNLHIGILVRKSGELHLADCSIGEGIALRKVAVSSKRNVKILEGNYWNKAIANDGIIVRRLPF